MKYVSILTLAAIGGIALMLACGADENVSDTPRPTPIVDNPELAAIFEQDQADRMADEIDWDSVDARDKRRRLRVDALIAADSLLTANDFFHAAMILQHGMDSLSYRQAYELAGQAVALDSTHEMAAWLYAAAFDRYLLSTGRPQWYGTQYLTLNDTTFLFPIDTTRVDDRERVRRGVRTLDQMRAMLAEQNGADLGLLQIPDSPNPLYQQ